MITLGALKLSQHDVENIVFHNTPIKIADDTKMRLSKCYELIKDKSLGDKPVYGINTGFGALAEIRIAQHDQETLQKNVIVSHAVGVGDPLDFFTAKALILLRLNTLLQGYSAASPALTHHLVALINANCAPFVPKKGSVGASGDLAPLAHLGLLCLGVGKALIGKEKVDAKSALMHADLKPLQLGIRDGLALINGTQAMTAVAMVALRTCRHLAQLADMNASLTLQAFGGHKAHYDERIHALKPHDGQLKTAKNLATMLNGYHPPASIKNKRTQDPYSLRCVPQVHGATKDVIRHVQDTVLLEINSVTDNPLIFIDEACSRFDVVSGGNFHGQHVAMALDYLAMAMATLANIAERRIELLLNEQHSNGLPPFLIDNSGLNSGYMMLHVTATALVSENKTLCHPSSVDSIPTSANREDHVSMGMNAANKLLDVMANTTRVLAIELMAACQAIDLRHSDYISPWAKRFYHSIRNAISFRKEDGLFYDDLHKTLALLDSEEMRQMTHELANN